MDPTGSPSVSPSHRPPLGAVSKQPQLPVALAAPQPVALCRKGWHPGLPLCPLLLPILLRPCALPHRQRPSAKKYPSLPTCPLLLPSSGFDIDSRLSSIFDKDGGFPTIGNIISWFL